MPHIQQLDSHISDLIAAGEVVERPASVAKELLENAIDAGATAIVVEHEHGGMTYLRITDNGCGISADELPTAFLRHATSKLRKASDLASIATLGFRGEALAAISAVSHIDIFSRQTGASMGASLHLDGGVPGETTETGCPEGTTICVRDLFYNTPARMKFMKKDSAEGTAINSIVMHLALSHPDISFKLIRDGQEILHTPGDGKLLSTIYSAIGRDFAMNLLPISGCSDGVKVEGFVTKPLAGHGTRAREIFFVNGRYVKNQMLSAALEEAYRNQLLKGKFPGCVLHITLPCDHVDVNVHPAKTVVKFVADKPVFDTVYYTILDTLNGERKPVTQEKPSFYQSMTAQEFREKQQKIAMDPPKTVGSYSTRPAIKETAPVVSTIHEEKKPVPTIHYTKEIKAPTLSPVKDTVTVKEIPFVPEKEPEIPQPAPIVVEKETPKQQKMEPEQSAPWRIAGEVLKTYIICEDDSGNVWLIDKHAAHERIRFDKLKENTQPLMSQTLLLPVTVSLEADEYATVLENLELLQEFAFTCEDFGDGTILVRDIPADIRMEDAQGTLEELAHKLLLGRADPTAARDELLHTMACKSAIKAGMTTDKKEMEVLVEMVQSGKIQYCPHGRPVKYKLTKYEIEKFFKRA